VWVCCWKHSAVPLMVVLVLYLTLMMAMAMALIHLLQWMRRACLLLAPPQAWKLVFFEHACGAASAEAQAERAP
jgi:hypothetical protein